MKRKPKSHPPDPAAAESGRQPWREYVADRQSEPLPPHDPDAERGALGCVLSAASDRDADSLLEALRDSMFYDLRHQKILATFRALRGGHRAVDLVTVVSAIGGGAAEVGGVPYLSAIADIPSVANFPSYLSILEESATRRRALAVAARLSEIAREPGDGAGERVRSALVEVGEDLSSGHRSDRPPLLITDPCEHLKFEPRTDLCLVGDHDVSKGYEGVCVVGGPPGCGKSLVASSLALAGVVGKGTWMGRAVHRRFKTLMIQAENGALRLRNEFLAMRAHASPETLAKFIRVSLPPEGGIPFHKAEFRRAVKRAVEDFAPDVVTVDPWTAVAADDAAKDVVEKLAEIRSCLPTGDDCPALVVVAHTRKPKAEGMRRGRGLLNELSGSLALGATARSVFVLLPFTDDQTDDRVLWSTAKLSNGIPAADSVWHRRLGEPFVPANASADEYWNRDREAAEERVAVTKSQLREVYADRLAMSRDDLCRALVDGELAAYQTARRITGPKGYLLTREWLTETPGGLLAIAR